MALCLSIRRTTGRPPPRSGLVSISTHWAWAEANAFRKQTTRCSCSFRSHPSPFFCGWGSGCWLLRSNRFELAGLAPLLAAPERAQRSNLCAGIPSLKRKRLESGSALLSCLERKMTAHAPNLDVAPRTVKSRRRTPRPCWLPPEPARPRCGSPDRLSVALQEEHLLCPI